MSSQLNELRLQLERLDYDNKEGSITIDILKEQNQDLTNELEELKKTVEGLKLMQKDLSAEDKEKKKAEKMAMMMAQFDTVSCDFAPLACMKKLCAHNRCHSKEHFLRRKICFALRWPNLIPLTRTLLYLS